MARRDLLICIALLLAILAVYSQVAHFDFVNYDDPDYTTGNPHVRLGLTSASIAWAFTSSYAANWFPLTWLSHMLDYQLFGANAGWHHVTNLALHILNTLLCFVLLKRMTGATAASAFVAFVFAFHPLHIESVAWISERKDLLSTLFWFLTIATYLSFVRRPGPLRSLLVAAVFCCALMSKSMAVTLPFVLLLLDYWPLQRFKSLSDIRLILEKVPLFALSVAASIVTFLVQRGGGAVLDSIPLGMRIENALVAYVVYLLKFLWPSNLAVFYPYAAIPLWEATLAAVVLATITVLVIGARAERPYLLVGWLWFLGTLVPVIGLVQVGVQARADRYTYLPIIGIAIMVAFGAKEIVLKRAWLKQPLALIASVVCTAWATLTFSDLGYWHDSITLFRHAIGATQNNFVAYSNLGAALRETGHPVEAIPNFERALEIMPHFADAEDGLGDALSSEGRFDEAMPHLAEAVRLEPKSISAHINLGTAFSRRGRPEEAADQYRTALQLDPESAEAHCGLGIALAELGRPQEALPQLFESVRINPNFADGHYNLGRVLGLQGRADEAMSEFADTIRLEPTNAEAHYNLATAYAMRDRMSDAAAEFRKAVELKPEYLAARFGYASALANMEDFDNAIAQFQAVLRMKPDFEAARESLARCIELRDHSGAQSKQPKPR